MKKSLLGLFLFVSLTGCYDSSSDGGGELVYPYLNDSNIVYSEVRSGKSDLPYMTKKEIKDAMYNTDAARSAIDNNNNETADNGNGYMQVLGQYTGQFSSSIIGQPKQEVLDLGLARVNFIRQLAGLNNVVVDLDYQNVAQHGAWISAKENKINHNIGVYDTTGFSEDFKKLCSDGVGLSNLYLRPHPSRALDAYMGENGNPRLGHRFYVLSRLLTSIGFGVSNGNEGFGANAMRFNMGKKPVDGIVTLEDRGTDWEITAWPTPGYFPVKTTLFDVNGGSFFHFAINDRYQMEEQTVIVINQYENDTSTTPIKTWKRVVTNVKKNNKGETTSASFIEPSGIDDKASFTFIDARTCIFRLGISFEKNHVFKVEIRGIKVRNSKDIFDITSETKHLRYSINFFDLNDVL